MGLTLVVLSCSGAMAQILPVTDARMMRSLNGEWMLKVVDGIDDHTGGVPEADQT